MPDVIIHDERQKAVRIDPERPTDHKVRRHVRNEINPWEILPFAYIANNRSRGQVARRDYELHSAKVYERQVRVCGLNHGAKLQNAEQWENRSD